MYLYIIIFDEIVQPLCALYMLFDNYLIKSTDRLNKKAYD